MECANCELKQRQFFCEHCLTTHIRDFRHQTLHFSNDRNDQVAKASKALIDIVHPARIRRATLAESNARLEELLSSLARLKKENDNKRGRLRTLRESLASRRRTLSAAKLLPHPVQAHSPLLRQTQELASLSLTLARARSGLVQELVEVFNVVEVGGRPPIGGKAGTKGEWTIGDLILPVPGDIRRYPPDHINAVITHTIHFLSLLTFYLGIKLPFEISWTGNKLGVGQPSIGAGRGGESGGWAKWNGKHPLHLSSTSPSQSPSTPQMSHSPSSTQSHSRTRTISSSSHRPPSDPTSIFQPSFTTALAMLLYNVSYLAYTQSVDVPLNQAGDVLSNLWSVCCSSELGRKSHETAPTLSAPTPPAFPLDFAQLLQATTANPSRRSGVGRAASDRVDGEQRRDREAGKDETIVEVDGEEEGWDLVES